MCLRIHRRCQEYLDRRGLRFCEVFRLLCRFFQQIHSGILFLIFFMLILTPLFWYTLFPIHLLFTNFITISLFCAPEIVLFIILHAHLQENVQATPQFYCSSHLFQSVFWHRPIFNFESTHQYPESTFCPDLLRKAWISFAQFAPSMPFFIISAFQWESSFWFQKFCEKPVAF